MNYLSAENISKSIGERWLFQGLNIGLNRGDKVALVGANGTGKTSLLDVLAGVQTPEIGGIVSVRKEIRVGYLSQNPAFVEEMSVMDTLFHSDNPLTNAVKTYEKAMLGQDDRLIAHAIEQMESLQAWDLEVKVKQILSKLGVTDFDKSVSQLSGGQRKRVALARLLIANPDLLILDEPTNHLDLEAIEWLEDYLSTDNTTLLLVTHDRYFLDNVCNEIMELTEGKLYRHRGKYAYFLEKKAEREAIWAAEVEKAQNIFRRELEWMRRQPQARGTKAQYRVDAFEGVKEKAQQRRDDAGMELNVQMTRQGGKILEVKEIGKSFEGKTLIKDFTYLFERKDRVGIIGKNGVGKSTFLNMMTGEIQPDSGKIATGTTTKFGYYTQDELSFDEGQRVIDVVKEIAEVITLGSGDVVSASQFLQLFQFDAKKQYTYVSKLSGGEKRRLQLLKVLIQSPNFLILDEPTNDLDINTLNILEDFLLNFGGCLVLVSHDRYFMDRLVNHLFVFEGEGVVRDFPGNYTDYRDALSTGQWVATTSRSNPTTAKAVPAKPIEAATTPTKKKLSFKEQKEFETLEKEIQALGRRKQELEEWLNGGTTDHQALTAWAAELQQVGHDLDEKEFRWLELSEYA
jgi:ABC transport system ATP-binding/permease protein